MVAEQKVQLLEQSSALLLSMRQSDETYQQFLTRLLEPLSCHHAMICSHTIDAEGLLHMQMQYSADTNHKHFDSTLIRCTYDEFGWLHDQLLDGALPLLTPDDDNTYLKHWLSSLGFSQVLLVPIFIAENLWGVLLLEGESLYPLQQEQELLMTLVRFLSASLAKEHTEQSLQTQFSNFDHIFYQSNTMMFVLSADQLTILAANQSVVNFYGYSLQALLGSTFTTICACRSEEIFALMREEKTGNEQAHYFIHHLKDKQVRHVLMYPSEVNLSGQQALLVIVFDITKRFESFQREKLYAKIYEESDEGIIICDVDEKIIEVNPAFEKITGYQKEDVLGQTPRILSSNLQDKAFYRSMWESINTTGHFDGEIWNRDAKGELFAIHTNIAALSNEAGEVVNYAGIFSDITKLKEHEQQLNRLAHYDPLTQLPNRTLLYDRLEMSIAFAKRYETQFAVCFIDLDAFKPINDRYGHDVGDEVLIQSAKRLKECVRLSDTVSRLGGDEFVIIVSEYDSMIGLETLLFRILDTVSQPIMISEHSMQVTASIGVALSHSQTDNPERLLRQADQAMYRAKQEGRNAFHIFDEAGDESVMQRHATINEMREAVQNNEFVLFYQPKVQMSASKVVGVEALIRWQHPTRGLLGPFEFLPYVDGHEFSLTLDLWVLEQAFKQSIAFQAKGLNISISVNIAGDSILNALFLQSLFSLVTRYPKLVKQSIELEVLETSTLHDIERASKVLVACTELGFTLALDDFGTGYSSLTYLRHLPVHTIKIDQSFVRDILDDEDDHALVQSLINLVGAFKLKIIAEGVESEAIGKALLVMDCDYAQGYAIAKPMPVRDLLAWLKQWEAPASWQAFAR